MNHTVTISADLRSRIIADRERLKSCRADHGHAIASIQSEIKSLETTQADLAQRAATLSVQVIADESAAQELSNVERRAAAVRTRLDQLRAKPMPAIDLAKTYEVLFSVIFHWQEAVKTIFLRDIAPWGLDEQFLRMSVSQVPAFTVLIGLHNWLSVAPSATTANIARMGLIYERALDGKINLAGVSDAAPEIPTADDQPQSAT